MKRFQLIILINLFFAICAFSQKVVDNPNFGSSTTDKLEITQIEINDDNTVMSFTYTNIPGSPIRIPADSYIEIPGDKKLRLVSTDGPVIGEYVEVPESGELKYKLVFPPIDKSTALLDFGEGEDGSWYFYNIELIPQENNSLFPEVLEGNWFRTDGSREWVYGFVNGKIIYQSEVYSDYILNKKGKKYKFSVKKEGIAFDILIKTGKNDNLLIGLNSNTPELFSRKQTSNQDYVIPNDEDFTNPIIESGIAYYRGFINGYLPRMGATAMIYANEIMENDQKSYLLPITADGSFEIELPLSYSHSVMSVIFGDMKIVFLEPGKSVFHFIDLTKNENGQTAKTLFMGEGAGINNDLIALDEIRSFNFNNAAKKAGEESNEAFRDKVLMCLLDQVNEIQEFAITTPASKKARTASELYLRYMAYQTIISHVRPMGPRDQKKPEPIDDSFFKFLPEKLLNDQISLVASSAFNTFTNRLFFADFIWTSRVNPYPAILDSVLVQGIEMSDNQRLVLDSLVVNQYKNLKDFGGEVEMDWRIFTSTHQELISLTSRAQRYEATFKNLNKYTGVDRGFLLDLNISQGITGMMKGSFKPLDQKQIKMVNALIKTPEVRDYIFSASRNKEEEIAAKKENNKTKTGFYVREAPVAKGDSIFEAIIAEYPGKVLFLDFWATWCSPCKDGIKRMKPLKEEYKGKDIEFIYISGPSSPQDTYDLMIPDIKGQHYRLDKDTYNYLSSRFKISGIPRYMLVGKDGKLVKDNLWTESFSNETLRNLFDEHLNE